MGLGSWGVDYVSVTFASFLVSFFFFFPIDSALLSYKTCLGFAEGAWGD